MNRIKTQDAEAALRQILSEKTRAAAGDNVLVSKAESRRLGAFLARLDHEIRSEGGKGARVHVDALVDRAASHAAALWQKHNPAGNGNDSVWLSAAEVGAIGREDPAQGSLTRAAVQRLAQEDGAGVFARVVEFFSNFDFHPNDQTGAHPLHHGTLPGGRVIDDADLVDPVKRAKVPAEVRKAYDFYRRLMTVDLGRPTLHQAEIGGHQVYVLYATTDGDDGYLEVLSRAGKPIVSARLGASELVGFDEHFGRARFSPRMVGLDEPAMQEGYSEPEEILARGQVPRDWQADQLLDQGQLHFDQNGRLGALAIPGLSGSANEELACAAFEYLWEQSLKFRVLGTTDPFLLGPRAEGSLKVGPFVRSTDGREFEVADWRDIDDGSYTLYFERTADGRLKLAIEQFNN